MYAAFAALTLFTISGHLDFRAQTVGSRPEQAVNDICRYAGMASIVSFFIAGIAFIVLYHTFAAIAIIPASMFTGVVLSVWFIPMEFWPFTCIGSFAIGLICFWHSILT